MSLRLAMRSVLNFVGRLLFRCFRMVRSLVRISVQHPKIASLTLAAGLAVAVFTVNFAFSKKTDTSVVGSVGVTAGEQLPDHLCVAKLFTLAIYQQALPIAKEQRESLGRETLRGIAGYLRTAKGDSALQSPNYMQSLFAQELRAANDAARKTNVSDIVDGLNASLKGCTIPE